MSRAVPGNDLPVSTSPPSAPTPPGPRGSLLRRYLRDAPSAPTSTVLALPLLVFYGIGILVAERAHNGVDLVSRSLFGLLGLRGYLGFYGTVVLATVVMAIYLGRRKRFEPAYFWPLLAESGLYAVVTGFASSFLTRELLTGLGFFGALPVLRCAPAGGYGFFEGLVVSAGAGLHEELVFRLLGIGAVARLLLGPQWRRPSGRLVLITVASSVLFSAAHYLAEPFALTSFVFRTAAGGFFAAVFLLRGFAVAAWTHALYDVWVIVVLGR